MPRYAIVDPSTRQVLNVIVADDAFASELAAATGQLLVKHDTASPGWTLAPDGTALPPLTPPAVNPVLAARQAALRAVADAVDTATTLDGLKAAVKALAQLL